jgi:small ligand-binding sensory domain FIST
MKPRTATTRISAGLSGAPGSAAAAAEAAAAAGNELGTGEPDVAFLFLSAHHLERAAEAAAAVREELRPGCLVGCVSSGVVAGRTELQEGPGAAVWAATLPGAEVEPYHAVALLTEEGAAVAGFPDVDDAALVTLLADITFPVSPFLSFLNEEHPGLPLVGGIATGGGYPGAQALILDDDVHDQGMVGVSISGADVRIVVSQGCSPIGREAVITEADGGAVHRLAGLPALEWMKTQLASLPPEEQRLAERGLLAGIVIDENKAEYERGDYLMRGLVAIDEESGAVVVGEDVRVGQTLRLHVRDAVTADDDLRESLGAALRGATPAGALLFTCNGRGTHMFPQPDHDGRLVSSALGSPAVAGFFCGGEIGPVGGRAFLHGFTATLALFLA